MANMERPWAPDSDATYVSASVHWLSVPTRDSRSAPTPWALSATCPPAALPFCHFLSAADCWQLLEFTPGSDNVQVQVPVSASTSIHKSEANVNHANLNEHNLRFDTCHCRRPPKWDSKIRRLHDVLTCTWKNISKTLPIQEESSCPIGFMRILCVANSMSLSPEMLHLSPTALISLHLWPADWVMFWSLPPTGCKAPTTRGTNRLRH